MRTKFLTTEVLEGQRRMRDIKKKIKAAYKFDKPEFHRVSVGERRGAVATELFNCCIEGRSICVLLNEENL